MPSVALQMSALAVVWLVTVAGLFSMARGVAHIGRQIAAGAPDRTRARPVGRRLWGMVATVLSHREFRGRPGVRAAHWLVMLSFPLLFLTLVTGFFRIGDPAWELPGLGRWAPWEWITEVFAWGGLVGIAFLMLVRTAAGAGRPGEAQAPAERTEPGPASSAARAGSPARAPSRFLGSTRWQARFVEWVVLIVCACVVVLRALDRAALLADPAAAPLASPWHFPLTAWMSGAFGGLDASALANATVALSAVKVCVSMLWMAVVGVQTTAGVAWHRFLAPVNLYARRRAGGGKALGAAAPLLVDGAPLRDPDAIPEDATLGPATAADLTWKDRLDFLTCTECGRCQEVCPAWATGKPLSPKLLVLALRDHVESAASTELRDATPAETALAGPGGGLVLDGLQASPHSPDVLGALRAAGATGPDGVARAESPLVPGVVSRDVLWDCTMCGACVAACPVDIEHVDHILALRRHQVLMEGDVPRALAKPMRSMRTRANPYGRPASRRLDWTRGLDFEVPVVGRDVESAADVDYLFWVGCAGAFDERAQRTTRAVARLLHRAGVTFAVLGAAETCTGDPARRAGDELLFQQMAHATIDALHEARASRILVTCAHCYNTLANEYPALGGRFQVVHHTQLLNQLVRRGRLHPVAPPEEGPARVEVTYHDPCFLARHNGVVQEPRALLDALPGIDEVEMPRHGANGFCCGAGGARAWMEETQGTRIAAARMDEAAGTGARVVATACPFCNQMLGAERAAGRDGEALQVKDVAVLLWEAVERGLADAGAGPRA